MDKGFTECTNVKKAQPLFRGHRQPGVPGGLGYYDLRKPEARAVQAEMAMSAGIAGFCYWHYHWFAGQSLPEYPFNELLKSGEPDFPLLSRLGQRERSGVWHGDPGKKLMVQGIIECRDSDAQ